MTSWRAIIAVLLLVIACAADAQVPQRAHALSAAERAWVRAHPVLKLGLTQGESPFEFRRRDGRWTGLTQGYINLIRLHSELTFDIVILDRTQEALASLRKRRLDLVTLVRTIGVPPAAQGIRYSLPYATTAAIVATRPEDLSGADGMAFDGRTIVLPASEADLYGPWLRQRFSTVNVVTRPDMRQALALLSRGGADLAIGSEAQLLPDLQREHGARLRFAALPVAMTADVRMALRDSDPMLLSIVNKSLASMSTAQIRRLRQDWLGEPNEDSSKIEFMVERYSEQATLVGALLLMAAGLAYQLYREHRRALRSERRTAMFLAVMSHEIRSPMNAVLAAVELLRFTPINAQQRHFVDLANNGANTLLRLLDDVLDVSKLEAGQLMLSLDPLDVVALANDVTALQQLRAHEKGITLNVIVLRAPPRLMLDASRLSQVLHNLVSNAIKFTETGGVEIQISMWNKASEPALLEIAVTDTGIGIAEKSQATLFRPYAQVAGTYKRSGGTGLGLVICRELVDLMQGTLMLDSAPGKGTRITVALPAERAPDDTPFAAPAAAAMPAVLDTDPAALRLHVLVVEDVPANQAVLCSQLASLSCDSTIAGNGASALACFSQREYDMVLMDCDLPDIDGYSLAGEWRRREAQEEQARCPVIAISASTGEEHAERCFEAGMDGILSKPIRLAKLRDIIELWCDVTLAAPMTEDAPLFGLPQVREAIARDIGDLLQAMAVREREPALRAAHRLHGAALAMQWTDFAQAAQRLEHLLHGVTLLGDEQFGLALQATVQAWLASAEN